MAELDPAIEPEIKEQVESPDTQTEKTSKEAPDLRETLAKELDKATPSEKPVEEPKLEPKPEIKDDQFTTYKKEEREKLAALPDDVKDILAKKENQYLNGINTFKERADFGHSMNRVFSPHTDYLKSLNVTPESAVENLLQSERILRQGTNEQRAAMLKTWAHHYNFDLDELVKQPIDPRIHNLEQQNMALQRERQNLMASQQDAETEHYTTVIQDFAQTHEHFEAVKPIMADLLEKGIAKDLDEAYAKAVRLDDNVFSKYQAQQLEESKKAELARANEAAKKAKAAAVSVRGNPTGSHKIQSSTNTYDTISQLFAEKGL